MRSGHRDALADDEGLELVEHAQVRVVVGVGAVDAAGDDDADGGRLAPHDADLDGAGLRAEQAERAVGRGLVDIVGLVGEVEVVERVAGGVALGDVEGNEVVELVLEFRPAGDVEAHAAEQVGQLVDGPQDRVQAADGGRAAGLGDVDRRQAGLPPAAGVGLPGVEGVLEVLLQGVDELAQPGPVGLVGPAQQLHQAADLPLGAEEADAEPLDRVRVVGGGEAGRGVAADGFDLFVGGGGHGFPVSWASGRRQPMDHSKLPRMSNTPDRPADAGPPPAEGVPYAAPAREPRDPGAGAQAWLSGILGVICLLIGANFARWLLSGGTWTTGVIWTAGPKAGQPVAYFELQHGQAWTETGIFLFGLALVLEAAMLLASSRAGPGVRRATVGAALVVTALATLVNAGVAAYLVSIGVTLPLFSLLATAFGGYMVATLAGEWSRVRE